MATGLLGSLLTLVARALRRPTSMHLAWSCRPCSQILTRKVATEDVSLPHWVQSVVREEWTSEVFDLELLRYKDVEEETVGMLQVAMACVADAPKQRPKIGQVLKMIEEIRGEGSPAYESYGETESPCVSEGNRIMAG